MGACFSPLHALGPCRVHPSRSSPLWRNLKAQSVMPHLHHYPRHSRCTVSVAIAGGVAAVIAAGIFTKAVSAAAVHAAPPACRG